MPEFFPGLRELNFISVLVRLVLAMLFGGFLGMERGRKRRPAGFRTYLLVCLGAALTMLLGQYLVAAESVWLPAGDHAIHADVSRMGAQVISGIGFLGAGTIVVTELLQVRGLTTAAGLWAAACMGLAVGSGFYECFFIAFFLIFAAMRLLPYVESWVLAHARTMTVYVEVLTLEDLSTLLRRVNAQSVEVREVRLDQGWEIRERLPNAIFTLRLDPGTGHEQVLADIAGLDCVRVIKEL